MFYECKALSNIDLSNFNTEKVTNMGSMFSLCDSLTSLNLSNFNSQNVIKIDEMFNGCTSLKKESVIVKDDKIIQELDKLN